MTEDPYKFDLKALIDAFRRHNIPSRGQQIKSHKEKAEESWERRQEKRRRQYEER